MSRDVSPALIVLAWRNDEQLLVRLTMLTEIEDGEPRVVYARGVAEALSIVQAVLEQVER
jgi:hypothetical protein